jgi:hypothetical protein
MATDNLWGEEEPFSDIPEAAQTGNDGKAVPTTVQYAPPVIPPQAPRRMAPPPPAPEPEEIEEEVEEVEDDFADVLSDAHLRLEQGSLYKMIMNHDLFAGVEADPKAVHNVQKEIRKFARERMEVMLGMRQEVEATPVAQVISPFNDLEVEVLKRLASKATNGATETEEANQVASAFKQAPKRNSINPIGGASHKKTAPAKKPLPTRPTAPVKRSKLDMTIEQIAREEGVPVELLELNVKGVGGKPIHELTASELEERNRLAAARRGTQVKSTSALPMPTFEQEQMKAQQQVSGFGSTPLGASILDAVKKMPIKNP